MVGRENYVALRMKKSLGFDGKKKIELERPNKWTDKKEISNLGL
jgi:hypothetical protein